MAVAVGNLVEAGGVHIAGGVAGGHPGRHAQGSHQHGHRRAEIFAVTLPAFKEEVVHAVHAKGGRVNSQVVGVVVFEVRLHSDRLVVRGGGVRTDLPGQLGDAGGQIRRQLGVAGPDPGGVVGTGGAQVIGFGGGYGGGELVGLAGVGDAAGGAHRQHIRLGGDDFANDGVDDAAVIVPCHRFQDECIGRDGGGKAGVRGVGVFRYGGADAGHRILQGGRQVAGAAVPVRVNHIAGRVEGFNTDIPAGADGLPAGEQAAAVVAGNNLKGNIEPLLRRLGRAVFGLPAGFFQHGAFGQPALVGIAGVGTGFPVERNGGIDG